VNRDEDAAGQPPHAPGDDPVRRLPPAGPGRRPGPLSPSERERSERARARGLGAPFIPGGDAPDREAAERTDRFYGRLLIAMVVVITLSGFVLGIIANLLGLLAR
jgi:hypothetical protein